MKKETLDKAIIRTLLATCIIIPALTAISELLLLFNKNAYKFINSETLLDMINKSS